MTADKFDPDSESVPSKGDAALAEWHRIITERDWDGLPDLCETMSPITTRRSSTRITERKHSSES